MKSAIKCLQSLENKFQNNSDLTPQYHDFIHEYINLSHMSLVDTNTDQSQVSFYLPHHGVIRESSMTTKLRVVLTGPQNLPLEFRLMIYNFYVDDLITSFESEQEAITICKKIISVLNQSKFPLRKWVSNSPRVLQEIQDNSDPISVLFLGDNEHSKTLGIQWLGKSDMLTYHISTNTSSNSVSKRSILSDIAKIFDPLGLVGPCVILAQIIIQKFSLFLIYWLVFHQLAKPYIFDNYFNTVFQQTTTGLSNNYYLG
ncbi:hypothetical protein NQ315_011358 [Exocentrus adspersus]|uniref:Reverse transcriptase domain-containing protein n=1 Tax=Exocentrus adspersus TaxID=1586481 RepID=A0AAV8VJN2_9CUCU|nr:hypothetical protein NQ315_011358 [Exocentrus adspersus]